MQGMSSIIYIILFFGILYFFLIRPQQKQQKQRKQMLQNLKVNDEIVTVGGIHGKIVKINDNDFILRAGDKLELKLDRNAVGYVKGDKGNKEGKKDNNKDNSKKNDKEEKIESNDNNEEK